MLFTLNGIAQGHNFLEHTIYLSGNPNVNNYFNSVTLQIDLIAGNTEITRPFIIAEGFDPGHIINPDEAYGDIDITDFDDDLAFADETLRQLIDIDDPLQSYDVIYINWNNGTGDIRDNSILLEKVLDWVNQVKVTNEPNVLLGQSMGGVIGKYTLARMEQEATNFNPNIPATSPHEVRLFIAHDAPIQGSNTAISTQHFSRHMLNFYIDTPVAYFLGESAIPAVFDIAQLGSSIINLFGANTSVNQFVSPSEYLTVQDTPAALQMNYYWVDYSEEATPDIHNIWQQQFEAMGYPQGSRNIAISNGNECTVDHGFSEGDVLLEINDLDNPDIFGDIVHMIGTGLGGALNGRLDLALLGVFPGASKWFYNFNLRATPDDGSNVYYGRVSYEKKLLWLIPTKIRVTRRAINAPNSILPYDSFSGGFFDVNNILDDLPEQLPPLIVHHDSFGFIPVLSALDIKKTNGSNPASGDYLKSYSGGVPADQSLVSGFDAFIVDNLPNQPINNEHISFQQRNGDWLADELQANLPGNTFPVLNNCNWVCDNSPFGIVGDDSFCNSATYTLNDTTYTPVWQIISGSSLVSTSVSGNSITITKNNTDSYGTIKLEAFINSGATCGNATATVRKTISLNKKPTVSFDNTALRDAILAGTTIPDESPFEIESGDIIPVNTTGFINELKWKYTRQTPLHDFEPYGSCLTQEILNNGLKHPNSVEGLVPLIDYSFISSGNFAVPLGSSPEISLSSTISGYFEVEATVANECGCDTETNVYVKQAYISPPPPPNPSAVDFTVSPNPYTSLDFGLTLSVTRADSTPPLLVYNCTFEIQNLVTGLSYYQTSFLFNQVQRNQMILPTLPAGTHVMKLTFSGETISKLLIVH